MSKLLFIIDFGSEPLYIYNYNSELTLTIFYTSENTKRKIIYIYNYDPKSTIELISFNVNDINYRIPDNIKDKFKNTIKSTNQICEIEFNIKNNSTHKMELKINSDDLDELTLPLLSNSDMIIRLPYKRTTDGYSDFLMLSKLYKNITFIYKTKRHEGRLENYKFLNDDIEKLYDLLTLSPISNSYIIYNNNNIIKIV